MKEDKYFGISNRIYPWKEMSDFESKLGDAAETNWQIRELYVQYYKHLNEDYYTKGKIIARNLFKLYYNDFSGEDFDRIYDDMTYCLHRYGLSFDDYCVFSLHRKSESQRKEYVSDKLRYYYCDILNSSEIENIMTNKYRCFQEYGIFYKREIFPLNASEDKDSFLNFIRKHPKFIYKPLSDHSGHGIVVVDSMKIDNEIWFEDKIKNSPGIIEEIVKQGEELNKLNPSSLNTCRIVTFTIKDKVYIVGGVLRMGIGNAITDNAGSGGIYAAINTKTGVVISDAKNHLNEHFLLHPTTHSLIPGFQLPQWPEALELINRMAKHRNGATLVSWDIAYSHKGWLMIEGNDNGAWRIIQSNLDIGKKKLLYSLMDQYFHINSTLHD